MEKWPVPMRKLQNRNFLGFCSYYRTYILDFAGITQPLHQLTWLQSGLSQNRGSIMDTDASHTATGGELAQLKKGNDHVSAYYSKSPSRPEENHSVTRRGLLAVVLVLQVFLQPEIHFPVWPFSITGAVILKISTGIDCKVAPAAAGVFLWDTVPER